MTGLFNQTVIDPQRATQLPLFHEPVQIGTAPLSAVDAKIAGKFADTKTQPLFGDSHEAQAKT